MAVKRRVTSEDSLNDEYDYCLRVKRAKKIHHKCYDDDDDEVFQLVSDDPEEEDPEEEILQPNTEDDPEEEVSTSMVDQEEDPDKEVSRIDKPVTGDEEGESPEEEDSDEDPEFHLRDEEIEKQDLEDRKEDDRHYKFISKPEKIPFNRSAVYPKKPQAIRSMPVGIEKKNRFVVKPHIVSSHESKRRTKKKLWNEDDEITILEGMIKLNRIKEKYGYHDLGGIYRFVKKFLHVEVSRRQLDNKIRNLKIKYQKNKKKAKHEKAIAFLEHPHEKELFTLSEKIWGVKDEVEKEEEEDAAAVNDSAIDANSTERENTEEKNGDDGEAVDDQRGTSMNHQVKQKVEEEDFWSMYPLLKESLKLEQFSEFTLSGFVKQGLGCIGNLKAKELEEKWRKLQVAETEVKLMQAQLIQEQTELILKSFS